MKILYLPDYNKPQNTKLIDKLSQEYEVIAPELTLEQQVSPAYVSSLIRNLLDEDFIILSEGLGAYWANLFGGWNDIFSLLINPCINPKEELSLNFPEFESFTIREGIVLIGQKFTEVNKAPLEDYFSTSHYAVRPYETTNQLENLIAESLEELAFYHRVRGYEYDTLSPVNPGFYGKGKPIQKIVSLLTQLDPIQKITQTNKHQGVYDGMASDIIHDIIFRDYSLEETITRRFIFIFGYTPSNDEVAKLAAQIKPLLPDKIQPPFTPFRQEKRDTSVDFSSEEITALKELNAKLHELEQATIPNAIELDETHQKRLSDSEDTLTKYDVIIATKVYLHDEDPDYDDDSDNYIEIFTQLVTGCSKNKEAMLARLTTDHNDLPVGHPLSGFKHCWLFHHLYAIAKVHFADLLRIGFVWVDVEVKYQQKFDW